MAKMETVPAYPGSLGAGDAPLVGPGDGEEARYRRAVVILSFGFLGVFGGFQAAQGLQTSLNATLGGINLACLYGTFSLLCLVAPPLLATFERMLGLRLLMLATALAYVAMVFSNVIDTPVEPSSIWALPIAVNTLVGMGAPLMWTTQNDYLSRCAWLAAGGANAPESELSGRAAEMTTRFNSLFFSIYQVAGLAGNMLASVIMVALHAGQTAKRALFCTLGVISTAGAALFLLLPRMPSAGASERAPSLLDTARLAATDPKTALLIPLMVTNGMTLADFFGDFQTDCTCPVAGPAFTGFVVATFYGVNSLATVCWGRMLARRLASRRTAYVVASALIAGYLAAKLAWPVPYNFEREGADWSRRREPSSTDIVVVFALAALFACGDAFYESGPPATLQTFYAGTEQVVPAMANYKLWQSLGFAVQFPIGVVWADKPAARSVLLLVLLALSLLCVLGLDTRVRRLDPPGSAAEARTCASLQAQPPAQ